MSNISQNQEKKDKESICLVSKCKRCGHPLKAYESKLRGYGLSCALKEGIIKYKSSIKKDDDSINLYLFINQ